MKICCYCKHHFEELHMICKNEDSKKQSSYACLECKMKIEENRKCHSITNKCQKEKTCQYCEEKYAACREVLVWTFNSKNQTVYIKSDFGFYVASLNSQMENKLVAVCAACARHSGITHSWVCNPDYLNDHSRAKCIQCKTINLNHGKKWGRGPCCW